MRIIEQYFDEITESNICKRIEIAGRTCYKSESKITEDSYKKFIKSIIASSHESVLEHGTITVEVSYNVYNNLRKMNLKFLNLTEDGNSTHYLSGNIRAFRDVFKSHLSDFYKVFLLYKCLKKHYPIFFEDISVEDEDYNLRSNYTNYVVMNKPFFTTDEEKLNHIYRTFRFVTNRGTSHELVRHRPASFSQESSRYCDYSKGKHNNEVTFIRPVSILDKSSEKYEYWKESMALAENRYLKMRKFFNSPSQEARGVLPIDLKTEIVTTCNLKEWIWIMKLRTSEKAHPQIRKLMLPLQKKFRTEYPDLF